MNICFIPHATLSQALISRTSEILGTLCEKAGAECASFHKGEVRYVRLVNATISVADVREHWANAFAHNDPVWVEDDELADMEAQYQATMDRSVDEDIPF